MRRNAGFVGGDAGVDLARGKHAVDAAEHGLAGAERVMEAQVTPALLGRVELAGEFAPHLIEGKRRRALEREDRLLLVADREHRAPRIGARAARREFGHDGAHDAPLLGAGILRLVDQHVVDAEIELVEHPGSGRAAEQVKRLVDKVVVIEQRAAFFLVFVACDHFRRDGDQRLGAFARGERTLARQEFADAVLFIDETRQPVGVLLGDLLGDDIGARLELGGAENLEIIVDAVAARGIARGFQRGDMLLVGNGAGIENFDQLRPFRRRDQRMRKEFLLEGFTGFVGGDAQRPGQFGQCLVDAAGALDPAVERVALTDGIADHVLESLIGSDHDGGGERLTERAVRLGRGLQQHGKRELVEQLRGRGVVQHGEARRHVGLERKLMEQPRAEGVDGLHLQPAWRLQRGGEQPARPRALRGVGFAAGRRFDLSVEFGVAERGPAGQPLEHLVRHVGGGGLGEGDAKNFRRIDAAQQQVDHALRQHIGLAGAGIG